MGAVKGRAEVYIDGGIRLGTDVLKALALGARAVFIGRPAIWGLATKVLNIIHTTLLERFSFECRKVIGFAFTTLCDWLKVIP